MELTLDDVARARREPILHADEVSIGVLDDAAGLSVVLIARHADRSGRIRVRMVRFDEASFMQLQDQLAEAQAIAFPSER